MKRMSMKYMAIFSFAMLAACTQGIVRTMPLTPGYPPPCCKLATCN